MGEGRFEPEFPISRINQDGVYRHDLGDLDPLCDSMTRLGLLTPVVVTNDGALLCGKRRLAAALCLGWQTVPVWIPAKVSDTLRIAALFDDETLHKSLTPIEQVELYAEYETLYAQQAKLRQQATRFKHGNQAAAKDAGGDDGNGPVESTEPFSAVEAVPSAREQAARAVTGSASQTRLEQVRELQRIAADTGENPWVRDDAGQALAGINLDGKVNGRWQHVKVQQQLARLEDTATDPDLPDPVRQAAAEAFTGIRAHDSIADQYREARKAAQHIAHVKQDTPVRPAKPVDPHAAEHRQVRMLVDLLRREHGWWDRNDPAVFGEYADSDQWVLVESYVEGAGRWLKSARGSRTTG